MAAGAGGASASSASAGATTSEHASSGATDSATASSASGTGSSSGAGGAGSVSSAASSSGAGQGGGPTACDDLSGCFQCGDCAVEGACSELYDACAKSPDCSTFAACIATCLSLVCIEDCAYWYPYGAEEYAVVAACVICGECPSACAWVAPFVGCP